MLSSFAYWPGAMISSHELEQPMSAANFHGSKNIRAI